MIQKRVIFCGTPNFACPSLQALYADPEFHVISVITQPDKPVGRKAILTPPPVKVVAQKLGIPVEQPEDINDENYLQKKKEELSSVEKIDFLVLVAYGQMLSKSFFETFDAYPVNVHPSLLPRWRGASPLQHTILSGDHEGGVTIIRMIEQLDAGPILSQESVAIAEDHTTAFLHDELAESGAQLLVKTLKNPIQENKQDESKATFCKRLARSDGEVDAKLMTAEEIDRRVRALVPWPGVQMEINGSPVKVHKTSLLHHSDAIKISCVGGSTLFVVQLQSPGKKILTGAEWKRGNEK